jgi:glycosyltransferase involved in cell wall biosynthesis
MEPLSVLIPTLDEEENLPECLESCSFASEIVVVDSGSRDATRDIAERFGATVRVREFDDHASQKNWGLDRVTHRWVLVLDADERVTPELRVEIERVLSSEANPSGYWIRRRNHFLGRPIRGCGWQRDKVLRLFDRTRGRYAPRRVHEKIEITGPVRNLQHHLTHYTCRDLSTWIRKAERYALLGAEEAQAKGRRPRAGDLVLRPAMRFLKQYVLQAGFRDGAEGRILCTVSAFGVFMKYAHLRELVRNGREAT